MARRSLPTRKLADRPDLDQLRRQAKELLEAFRAREDEAVTEVTAHYRGADAATFALHDAQLVLARAYGFESWPRLKAHVEGVTVKRLAEAVRADDLASVRAMLTARPELAARSVENYQVLHFAVFNRLPDMVRLLMRNGANAREGVYPYRDSTGALTLAAERGYDEIVAIIHEEEQRRRQAKTGVPDAPAAGELFEAFKAGSDDRAIAIMQANPALIHTCDPVFEWTPLHLAAGTLNTRLALWLLEQDAEVDVRDRLAHMPLTLAAHRSDHDTAERFSTIAHGLLQRGAELTPGAAVALGDADWLRAQHASGSLTNPIEDWGGLLRIAVSHNRPDILKLLLDFGFDPDERVRFQAVGDPDEVVFTWGMPLWHCASSGKHEMAAMLLERGADPNADMYASGTPVSQAYRQRDRKMIQLLERYGGVVDAGTVGLYRLTDRARQILADTVDAPMDRAGQNVAAQLLGGAAGGGDAEIVRLALERVDWARDDGRWFSILEQPIRRGTDLECFRLVLERCNSNIRGRGPFGVTLLHSVAGSSEQVTAEQRLAFATTLLGAGARLDLRDNLLKSTPLGWACRWGRIELVKLFLERGADPVEPDAEPWATPRTWAGKMKHADVLAILREHRH